MTTPSRTAPLAARLGPSATIGASSTALATTMVPVFLVGALSAVIGADLGFDEATTGIIVTGFYLAAAVLAIPLGSLTERIGAGRAMRSGVLLSAAGCAVAATLVNSAWQLGLLMVVLGATLPMVDTGAARAFTTTVPSDRRGIAFGIKEASVPLASLLAGLAVPLLATTVGWRVAFLGGVLVGPLAVVSLRLAVPAELRRGVEGAGARGGTDRTRSAPNDGRAPGSRTVPSRPRLRPAVRLLAASFALSGAGAAAVVTFLVPAATAGGMSSANAGLTLAIASAGGIVARLAAGVIADRRPSTLGPVLVLAMLAGAVGTAALASEPPGVAFVIVALVTLTAGWGWTGLGFAALTQVVPHAPATAAGAGILGLALGGTLGPTLFGQLAARGSYSLAWTVIAAVFLAGTVCAYAGLRLDRFMATD